MLCFFSLQMENKGSVKLEYSWQVLMETYGKTACFEHGGKPSALKCLWSDVPQKYIFTFSLDASN